MAGWVLILVVVCGMLEVCVPWAGGKGLLVLYKVHLRDGVNPFSTAVPTWGQNTWS